LCVGTEEYLNKPQSFYMGDLENMQKDFFFFFGDSYAAHCECGYTHERSLLL